MSILTLPLTAFPSQFGMPSTSGPKCLDLVIMRGAVGAKCLDKFDAFGLNGSNRFRSSVQEALHHCRFVRALDPTIQPVICRLESHLNKGVGRESMSSDKRLPVSLELERLTVVLTDQIGDSGFCKTHPRFEFRGKLPSELFRLKFKFLVGLDNLARLCLVVLALWR